jgi:hypothetical protein
VVRISFLQLIGLPLARLCNVVKIYFLQLIGLPLAPDDGCKGHPNHVECIAEIKKKAKDCIKLVVY